MAQWVLSCAHCRGGLCIKAASHVHVIREEKKLHSSLVLHSEASQDGNQMHILMCAFQRNVFTMPLCLCMCVCALHCFEKEKEQKTAKQFLLNGNTRGKHFQM